MSMSFDLQCKLRQIGNVYEAIGVIRECYMTKFFTVINQHCELYDCEMATALSDRNLNGVPLTPCQVAMLVDFRNGRRVKEQIILARTASLVRRAINEQTLTHSQVYWIFDEVQQIPFTDDFITLDDKCEKSAAAHHIKEQQRAVIIFVRNCLCVMTREMVKGINEMRKTKVFYEGRDLFAIQSRLMEQPIATEPQPEVDGVKLIAAILKQLKLE